MSAVLGVFCPKSQRPLNDFENELIRVHEGVPSLAGRTSMTNVTPQALKDRLVEYQKKMDFRHERVFFSNEKN